MAPRYRVTLTSEEREMLVNMTKDGKTPAKRFAYARALLLCDKNSNSAWTVKETAEALGLTARTIEHLKQRFVEEGMDAALERKVSDKPRAVRFGGEFEARLIALACSDPPEGRTRWTIRLLADKAVELNIADNVSPMTVCNTLKKTSFNLTDRYIGKSRRMQTQHS